MHSTQSWRLLLLYRSAAEPAIGGIAHSAPVTISLERFRCLAATELAEFALNWLPFFRWRAKFVCAILKIANFELLTGSDCFYAKCSLLS